MKHAFSSFHRRTAAWPVLLGFAVAGAGHMLTMEQPDRVSQLLVDWLLAAGPMT